MNERVEKLLARAAFALTGLVALVVAFFAVISIAVVRKSGYWFQRVFGTVWCKGLGIHSHVEGLENVPRDRAFILAPNHESMFDIFVIQSLPLQFVWISKAELRWVPFVGWAMKLLGCYFVRRDRSERDIEVMKQVEEGLRHERSLIVFPEGTRSRTGELLPFKKGAFRLAQNSGAPLIPIALIGTRAIAPPKGLPVRWGHDVVIRIGKPRYLSPTDDLMTAMDAFRADLIALLQLKQPL